MIKKFKKIQNLGIFENFVWSDKLPEFGRCNVIYGWNGSGKTTLSKLFDALGSGIHPDFETLEYEIECTNGKFKNKQSFDKKVRVFNQDYILKNLKIMEGKANSITLVLGEENKELIEQIKNDEKILYGDPEIPGSVGKIKQRDLLTSDLTGKNKERDKQFTDVARVIAATGGEAVRSYNSKNAKSSFLAIETPQLLSVEQIAHCKLVLSQKSEPEIQGVFVPPFIDKNENPFEKDLFDVLTELLEETNVLFKQTVVSNVIERFKKLSDVCEWVEAGIKIHEKHNSEYCEFCNQKLPEERLQELANHFNEEDGKMKIKIEAILERLREVYKLLNSVVLIDSARFYEEFRDRYNIASADFELVKKTFLDFIIDIGNQLKEKKLRTSESINTSFSIDKKEFIRAVENVNELIRAHNLKISNLAKEKGDANHNLEMHHLSEVFDDIKQIDTAIENLKTKISEVENGIPDNPENLGILALQARVGENQAKISNTQKACQDINSGLTTFLGRSELAFEPLVIKVEEGGVEKSIEQGYVIKRNGDNAKNLSEGEKTAIAFVYFTVHLKDNDFDIEKGIVVVDDPISSLDSNSLFQSFAFLKNAVKDAYQVFLFTHNYDFLRLLLNWIHHLPKKYGKKGYYMINNLHGDEGSRTAYLMELDKTLQEHESEYHYLFKCLYEFESDGTILNVYHIPNIARKVLETFLMFRVPNNKKSYEKLSLLDFDENKKTAIHKFTNDQSHITGGGFDPALIAETQKNVKYLLEMMESVFPEHYSILSKYVVPIEEEEAVA